MKKVFLLLAVIFIAAATIQTATAQINVGGHVGLMNYYGDAIDVGQFSFPFGSANFGAGIFVEKPIGRFFIPQVQLGYGRFNAEKGYADINTQGDILDLSLKLQLDWIELIKKDAKLQFTSHIGGVLGFYNSEMTRTSTGALIDVGTMNQQTGYNPAFGLSFGSRLGYQVTPKLLAYINSDTRVYFSDEIDDYRGPFSSDGIGGLAGNDWTHFFGLGVSYTINPKSKDIYEEPQPLIAEQKDPDSEVNGLFTYNNLPKAGVKMDLFDANNQKIGSTVTDINGQFKFDNLDPDKNYIVKLGEEDKGMFNAGSMYIINEQGERVASASKPGFNSYTFTKLTNDSTEALPVLVEDFPTTEMTGVFVYEELPKGGAKIYLVDEMGNHLDSAITRADGSFKFTKLNPNGNYLVMLDEEDKGQFPNANIFFTNDKGEPVMKAATADKGGYSFKAMDEEELATLDVLTAEDGNLLYRKLTEEKPLEEEVVKVEKGDVRQDMKNPTKKESPVLDGSNFENETIYFRHNSFWISQNQQGTKGSIIAKKLKAAPSMRIRIEGWASQPGDEAYNMTISKNRAEALKKLLVTQYGIEESRIEAVGKGEVEDSKLPESEARRARIFVIK